MIAEPGPDNGHLLPHALLLIDSHRRLTGRNLVDPNLAPPEAAHFLYHAQFVVLSHDASADPCFTYANLAAQTRFEMTWQEIIGLPSRYSAEPLAREARAALLEKVAAQGFVDDYSGVRIAKSGRRFIIRNASVWNLIDESGRHLGQAATFGDCEELSEKT